MSVIILAQTILAFVILFLVTNSSQFVLYLRECRRTESKKKKAKIIIIIITEQQDALYKGPNPKNKEYTQ
jgi:hypothetical protein